MFNCGLCEKSVLDGIYLSHGGSCHDECLDAIQKEQQEIGNRIGREEIKILEVNSEIQRRNGFWFKFMSILSVAEDQTNRLFDSISVFRKNISKLNYDLELLSSKTRPIYDYFLTYPPDWEDRRTLVARRDGEVCSRCRNHGSVHLHHKIALSNGGANKLENLIFLCEGCHSKEHGGRDFSGEFSHEETAFSKRVSAIRYAINNQMTIEFGYKKPTDIGHKKRTVLPRELTNVVHMRGSGSTLCLVGYCQLRKAKRVFALKRMRGVKVLPSCTQFN